MRHRLAVPCLVSVGFAPGFECHFCLAQALHIMDGVGPEQRRGALIGAGYRRELEDAELATWGAGAKPKLPNQDPEQLEEVDKTPPDPVFQDVEGDVKSRLGVAFFYFAVAKYYMCIGTMQPGRTYRGAKPVRNRVV